MYNQYTNIRQTGCRLLALAVVYDNCTRDVSSLSVMTVNQPVQLSSDLHSPDGYQGLNIAPFPGRVGLGTRQLWGLIVSIYMYQMPPNLLQTLLEMFYFQFVALAICCQVLSHQY